MCRRDKKVAEPKELKKLLPLSRFTGQVRLNFDELRGLSELVNLPSRNKE